MPNPLNSQSLHSPDPILLAGSGARQRGRLSFRRQTYPPPRATDNPDPPPRVNSLNPVDEIYDGIDHENKLKEDDGFQIEFAEEEGEETGGLARMLEPTHVEMISIGGVIG
jgi:hypothetical protein